MNLLEIITGAFTIVFTGSVGCFIWYFKHYLEIIRNKEKRLYQERRILYTDILKPFIHGFAGIKIPSESKKAQKEIISFNYRKISCEFNMIASDNAISALNDYMQHIFNMDKQNNEGDEYKVLILWSKILIELRKDLGNKDTKLKPEDMLKIWITDIDKLLE